MRFRNPFKRPVLVQLNSLGEPVTPLKELTFKAIPVSYAAGFVPGVQLAPVSPNGFYGRIQYDKKQIVVERPARVHVWQVAVKTTEPDIYFPNHAGWMLHIMYMRSDLIRHQAMRDSVDIQRDASMYYQSIRNQDCEPKVNILPNN